jgi:hypothetical protein
MKVMDCMAMNDDIDIDTMTMLEAIRNLSKEELISMIIDVPKQRRIAQMIYLKGYMDMGEHASSKLSTDIKGKDV